MDILEEIIKRAKQIFLNSKGSHDWEHTLRVYDLCLHIGKKENADMEILKIASILHDIGDSIYFSKDIRLKFLFTEENNHNVPRSILLINCNINSSGKFSNMLIYCNN